MIKFNRLKELSTDLKVIAEALDESKSSLIELNEDKTQIRRVLEKPIPEMNEERKEMLKDLTIYAKGFPLESSMTELMTYFEEYGKVQHVQMRRDKQKKFKGSVFVIFEEKSSLDKFLAEEGTKYGETELVKMLKDDYWKKKIDEKKDRREQEKQDKEQAEQKRIDEERNRFLERVTKGAVLKLTGIAKTISFEEVKKFFNEVAEVAYVAYKTGDTEMNIRFKEENDAKKVFEQLEKSGKILYNEEELDATVLEGEEEIEYWKDLFRERKSNPKSRRGGKRQGGNRGGYGPNSKKRRVNGNN
ncbi:DgyrCDS1810 [Dimorphilus gyrociliatus]|nr:DgyrCDS1810 [Dimorphilus gyrociliatus]